MTLGSPASSPTRNGQGNITYLPPYLIREAPTHVSPTSPTIGSWNTPITKSSAGAYPVHKMSPILSRKSLYQSPAVNPINQVLNSPTVGKSGGPPVQGLFDSVASPRTPGMEFSKLDDTPHTPSFMKQESRQFSGVLSPNKSFSHNTSSFMSPAQIDPFYTQGEAISSSTQLDETWVTIFGFPPAATNYILQQFSHYGKITDQKLETSGNWIHIKYQSKLQAKKALSKNGKIFGSSIMVGVKPCIEVELMNESAKENSDNDVNSSNFCQDSFSMENLDTSRRSLKNIRQLTQIYKTPTSDAEGTPKPKTQPKANSFVSKAMEYVLKW